MSAPDGPTPVYQLEEVRKEYAGRTVLDLARLEVREGEILSLVGPSGAGKSTLLRILNLIEPPTSGRLVYAGQAINGRAPLELRRQVTTVFQRPLLLQGSVRANVAYGLHLRGAAANGTVEAMLERVGLRSLARAEAHTLSGGEMQRVALARALTIGPRVLLLDEPTANLDPYNVGLIEDIVRDQNRQQGTTVVLVTHNIFQARRLAHRTGLLLSGQLVEVAETHAFFESPMDPRTAAFVRGDLVC